MKSSVTGSSAETTCIATTTIFLIVIIGTAGWGSPRALPHSKAYRPKAQMLRVQNPADSQRPADWFPEQKWFPADADGDNEPKEEKIATETDAKDPNWFPEQNWFPDNEHHDEKAEQVDLKDNPLKLPETGHLNSDAHDQVEKNREHLQPAVKGQGQDKDTVFPDNEHHDEKAEQVDLKDNPLKLPETGHLNIDAQDQVEKNREHLQPAVEGQGQGKDTVSLNDQNDQLADAPAQFTSPNGESRPMVQSLDESAKVDATERNLLPSDEENKQSSDLPEAPAQFPGSNEGSQPKIKSSESSTKVDAIAQPPKDVEPQERKDDSEGEMFLEEEKQTNDLFEAPKLPITDSS